MDKHKSDSGMNLDCQIHQAWLLHQQSFRLALKQSWPWRSILFSSVLKKFIIDSDLTFQICPPANHRERPRSSHREWKEPSSGKLWMWRTDLTHLQNDPHMSHCRILLSTNIQKRNILQLYTAVEYIWLASSRHQKDQILKIHSPNNATKAFCMRRHFQLQAPTTDSKVPYSEILNASALNVGRCHHGKILAILKCPWI